jgi:sulfur carrier protein ThiS
VNANFVLANGKQIEARLPCAITQFLVAQGLSPRSVVVEHNGEAVVSLYLNPALAGAGLTI